QAPVRPASGGGLRGWKGAAVVGPASSGVADAGALVAAWDRRLRGPAVLCERERATVPAGRQPGHPQARTRADRSFSTGDAARAAVGGIEERPGDADGAGKEQPTGAVRAGAGGDVGGGRRPAVEAIPPPLAPRTRTLLRDGAPPGNGRVAERPSLRRIGAHL